MVTSKATDCTKIKTPSAPALDMMILTSSGYSSQYLFQETTIPSVPSTNHFNRLTRLPSPHRLQFERCEENGSTTPYLWIQKKPSASPLADHQVGTSSNQPTSLPLQKNRRLLTLAITKDHYDPVPSAVPHTPIHSRHHAHYVCTVTTSHHKTRTLSAQARIIAPLVTPPTLPTSLLCISHPHPYALSLQFHSHTGLVLLAIIRHASCATPPGIILSNHTLSHLTNAEAPYPGTQHKRPLSRNHTANEQSSTATLPLLLLSLPPDLRSGHSLALSLSLSPLLRNPGVNAVVALLKTSCDAPRSSGEEEGKCYNGTWWQRGGFDDWG
uniref:Uncharacterized protein n=1 Tax=Physcomitrium patens TaxID=3218 RepID=A9SZS8_PHYPA|nr:hypothetical protein PHYPA_005872 [Physcomitrium patens]